MPVLGAMSAAHAQKEPSVQQMGSAPTVCVPMAHTLTQRVWTVVNSVQLGTSAPAWACHQRLSAIMAHTAMSAALCFALCALQGTGECSMCTGLVKAPGTTALALELKLRTVAPPIWKGR